ncbi:hypothetical protein A4G19_07580 [Pasteurellaceae bacterium Macca]|nr:hypothetical protein [Pasteurellaceae bacterium Macca]
MKKIALIVSALLSFSTMAQASNEVFFHCYTAKGKQIYLSYNDSNDTVTYAFGKNLQAPEIRLTRPSNQVGSAFFNNNHELYAYLISIPNGNITYVVSDIDSARGHEYGVSVRKTKNEEEFAFVHCKNNRVKISNLNGLADKVSGPEISF